MALKKVHKSKLEITVNNLFSAGKKRSAEKAVLFCLKELKKETKVTPTTALDLSIENACPLVQMKSKKVGGISYKIPVHIFESKRGPLGIKWIVSSSCGRKVGNRSTSLSNELRNSWNNKGITVQRKKSLHNLAIVNRAYIKFL